MNTKFTINFLGLFLSLLFTGIASGQSIVYKALEDFTVLPAEGEDATYYNHTARNALAIAATNTAYRKKFARAEVTFDGTAGTYSFKLTGLQEKDGETSYKIFVNDVQIGTTQQNNRIQGTSIADYTPQVHEFPATSLKPGDVIQVQSDCASNSLIKEGSGFAWARGRWTQLELVPSGVSVNHYPVSAAFPTFSVISDPLNALVSIQFQTGIDGEFTIYSANGKAVWSSPVTGETINWNKTDANGSRVQSGSYTGVLSTGTQSISRRFVVF